MKKLSTAFVVICALAVAGCASAPKTAQVADLPPNPYQSVYVTTPGTQGAQCRLQTSTSTYTLQAPGSAVVERGSSPLKVFCQKGPHFVGQTVIFSKPNPYSNALQAYSYPDSVSVALGINALSLASDVVVF